jgi:hypothetical protein
VEYLPLYSQEQARRHEVRPGITGWAQVNGRNAITWQQKFEYDVWYVDHLTFKLDLKIFIKTILKVFKREGINQSDSFKHEYFKRQYNMNFLITSAGRRVSLVREFQFELKRNYPDGKVFCVDRHPELSSACQIADNSYRVPSLKENGYIETLLNLCKSNDIQCVIPTIDTELLLLSDAKWKFESEGIHCVVSQSRLIEICRKKKYSSFF